MALIGARPLGAADDGARKLAQPTKLTADDGGPQMVEHPSVGEITPMWGPADSTVMIVPNRNGEVAGPYVGTRDSANWSSSTGSRSMGIMRTDAAELPDGEPGEHGLCDDSPQRMSIPALGSLGGAQSRILEPHYVDVSGVIGDEPRVQMSDTDDDAVGRGRADRRELAAEMEPKRVELANGGLVDEEQAKNEQQLHAPNAIPGPLGWTREQSPGAGTVSKEVEDELVRTVKANRPHLKDHGGEHERVVSDDLQGFLQWYTESTPEVTCAERPETELLPGTTVNDDEVRTCGEVDDALANAQREPPTVMSRNEIDGNCANSTRDVVRGVAQAPEREISCVPGPRNGERHEPVDVRGTEHKESTRPAHCPSEDTRSKPPVARVLEDHNHDEEVTAARTGAKDAMPTPQGNPISLAPDDDTHRKQQCPPQGKLSEGAQSSEVGGVPGPRNGERHGTLTESDTRGTVFRVGGDDAVEATECDQVISEGSERKDPGGRHSVDTWREPAPEQEGTRPQSLMSMGQMIDAVEEIGAIHAEDEQANGQEATDKVNYYDEKEYQELKHWQKKTVILTRELMWKEHEAEYCTPFPNFIGPNAESVITTVGEAPKAVQHARDGARIKVMGPRKADVKAIFNSVAENPNDVKVEIVFPQEDSVMLTRLTSAAAVIAHIPLEVLPQIEDIGFGVAQGEDGSISYITIRPGVEGREAIKLGQQARPTVVVTFTGELTQRQAGQLNDLFPEDAGFEITGSVRKDKNWDVLTRRLAHNYTDSEARWMQIRKTVEDINAEEPAAQIQIDAADHRNEVYLLKVHAEGDIRDKIAQAKYAFSQLSIRGENTCNVIMLPNGLLAVNTFPGELEGLFAFKGALEEQGCTVSTDPKEGACHLGFDDYGMMTACPIGTPEKVTVVHAIVEGKPIIDDLCRSRVRKAVRDHFGLFFRIDERMQVVRHKGERTEAMQVTLTDNLQESLPKKLGNGVVIDIVEKLRPNRFRQRPAIAQPHSARDVVTALNRGELDRTMMQIQIINEGRSEGVYRAIHDSFMRVRKADTQWMKYETPGCHEGGFLFIKGYKTSVIPVEVVRKIGPTPDAGKLQRLPTRNGSQIEISEYVGEEIDTPVLLIVYAATVLLQWAERTGQPSTRISVAFPGEGTIIVWGAVARGARITMHECTHAQAAVAAYAHTDNKACRIHGQQDRSQQPGQRQSGCRDMRITKRNSANAPPVKTSPSCKPFFPTVAARGTPWIALAAARIAFDDRENGTLFDRVRENIVQAISGNKIGENFAQITASCGKMLPGLPSRNGIATPEEAWSTLEQHSPGTTGIRVEWKADELCSGCAKKNEVDIRLQALTRHQCQKAFGACEVEGGKMSCRSPRACRQCGGTQELANFRPADTDGVWIAQILDEEGGPINGHLTPLSAKQGCTLAHYGGISGKQLLHTWSEGHQSTFDVDQGLQIEGPPEPGPNQNAYLMLILRGGCGNTIQGRTAHNETCKDDLDTVTLLTQTNDVSRDEVSRVLIAEAAKVGGMLRDRKVRANGVRIHQLGKPSFDLTGIHTENVEPTAMIDTAGEEVSVYAVGCMRTAYERLSHAVISPGYHVFVTNGRREQRALQYVRDTIQKDDSGNGKASCICLPRHVEAGINICDAGAQGNNCLIHAIAFAAQVKQYDHASIRRALQDEDSSVSHLSYLEPGSHARTIIGRLGLNPADYTIAVLQVSKGGGNGQRGYTITDIDICQVVGNGPTVLFIGNEGDGKATVGNHFVGVTTETLVHREQICAHCKAGENDPFAERMLMPIEIDAPGGGALPRETKQAGSHVEQTGSNSRDTSDGHMHSAESAKSTSEEVRKGEASEGSATCGSPQRNCEPSGKTGTNNNHWQEGRAATGPKPAISVAQMLFAKAENGSEKIARNKYEASEPVGTQGKQSRTDPEGCQLGGPGLTSTEGKGSVGSGSPKRELVADNNEQRTSKAIRASELKKSLKTRGGHAQTAIVDQCRRERSADEASGGTQAIRDSQITWFGVKARPGSTLTPIGRTAPNWDTPRVYIVLDGSEVAEGTATLPDGPTFKHAGAAGIKASRRICKDTVDGEDCHVFVVGNNTFVCPHISLLRSKITARATIGALKKIFILAVKEAQQYQEAEICLVEPLPIDRADRGGEWMLARAIWQATGDMCAGREGTKVYFGATDGSFGDRLAGACAAIIDLTARAAAGDCDSTAVIGIISEMHDWNPMIKLLEGKTDPTGKLAKILELIHQREAREMYEQGCNLLQAIEELPPTQEDPDQTEVEPKGPTQSATEERPPSGGGSTGSAEEREVGNVNTGNTGLVRAPSDPLTHGPAKRGAIRIDNLKGSDEQPDKKACIEGCSEGILISLFDGGGSTRHILSRAGVDLGAYVHAECVAELRAPVAEEFGYSLDERWCIDLSGRPAIYLHDVWAPFRMLQEPEGKLMRQIIAVGKKCGSKYVIVGGSPCVDLTVSGAYKGALGFCGQESWHFHAFLAYIIAIQKGDEKAVFFVLLENAGSMKSQHLEYMTRVLKIPKIFVQQIDTAEFTIAKRNRNILTSGRPRPVHIPAQPSPIGDDVIRHPTAGPSLMPLMTPRGCTRTARKPVWSDPSYLAKNLLYRKEQQMKDWFDEIGQRPYNVDGSLRVPFDIHVVFKEKVDMWKRLQNWALDKAKHQICQGRIGMSLEPAKNEHGQACNVVTSSSRGRTAIPPSQIIAITTTGRRQSGVQAQDERLIDVVITMREDGKKYEHVVLTETVWPIGVSPRDLHNEYISGYPPASLIEEIKPLLDFIEENADVLPIRTLRRKEREKLVGYDDMFREDNANAKSMSDHFSGLMTGNAFHPLTILKAIGGEKGPITEFMKDNAENCHVMKKLAVEEVEAEYVKLKSVASSLLGGITCNRKLIRDKAFPEEFHDYMSRAQDHQPEDVQAPLCDTIRTGARRRLVESVVREPPSLLFDNIIQTAQNQGTVHGPTYPDLAKDKRIAAIIERCKVAAAMLLSSGQDDVKADIKALIKKIAGEHIEGGTGLVPTGTNRTARLTAVLLLIEAAALAQRRGTAKPANVAVVEKGAVKVYGSQAAEITIVVDIVNESPGHFAIVNTEVMTKNGCLPAGMSAVGFGEDSGDEAAKIVLHSHGLCKPFLLEQTTAEANDTEEKIVVSDLLQAVTGRGGNLNKCRKYIRHIVAKCPQKIREFKEAVAKDAQFGDELAGLYQAIRTETIGPDGLLAKTGMSDSERGALEAIRNLRHVAIFDEDHKTWFAKDIIKVDAVALQGIRGVAKDNAAFFVTGKQVTLRKGHKNGNCGRQKTEGAQGGSLESNATQPAIFTRYLPLQKLPAAIAAEAKKTRQ